MITFEKLKLISVFYLLNVHNLCAQFEYLLAEEEGTI